MPRLDETSVETTNQLEAIDVDWEQFVENNCPIDVCRYCYQLNDFTDDAEHPPYEDAFPGGEFYCAICNDKLNEIDN